MPHKFNADRRDKIRKQKFSVSNWAECTKALRRRGDLTIWVSEDAFGLWAAPRRMTRGGQRNYSDLAIEMCLTLGVLYRQPLRQMQGLMRSIAKLLGVEISVLDFSTLSRRCGELALPKPSKMDSQEPIYLAVDNNHSCSP